jgi:hypothetical protein
MIRPSNTVSALLLLVAATGPATAEAPRLALPIDCQPEKTCFVQKFVDAAPGPEVQDYLCGEATDNGHTGTDIRLLNLRAAMGIAVQAAAPGIVTKTRDGIDDKMVMTEADAARVDPIGLGNAVIIDHGDGWQTIYGHMRKGSLKVHSGDTVEAGTPVGEVGLSGLTEYPHVHFEVRHNGKVIDPYTSAEAGVACMLDPAAATKSSLWASDVLQALGSNETRILEVGFAGAPLTPRDLEVGLTPRQTAGVRSPGLVFYARLMNMREGDQVRFVLEGPGGWGQIHALPPVDKPKATFVGYAGRKLKSDRWPVGRYTGKAELYRAGRVVHTAESELTLEE